MDANAEFSIATAPKLNSSHWRPNGITWGDIVSWVRNPASEKEAGNYFLGELKQTTVIHKGKTDPCTNFHRRKQAVLSRGVLTLDVDYPKPDFLDVLEMMCPWAALVHTTYNSAPDAKRYRLLIPLDRPASPEEYLAAAEYVLQQLGNEQFDPSTVQPERYMFLPSAQEPGWFESRVLEGPPAALEELLKEFERDLSAKPLPPAGKRKKDPTSLDGVAGAFNRAYEDLDFLIGEYELPYERVDDDRYQLVGSLSMAGFGPVPDIPGLYFSHHSTDPAYGVSCSAFDLVRLHRFGWMDEDIDSRTPINRLPSNKAMTDLASSDPRVTAELVGVDFDKAMDDDVVTPNAWKLGLRFSSRNQTLIDGIHNWDLITANDPVFARICYNEMSLSPELSGDVPWRKVTDRSRTLNNADRWEISHYLQREFPGFSPIKQTVDAMIDTTAMRRVVNPVRAYLEALVWDGTPRVETALPGAAENSYNSMVARKVFAAAAARMLEPGIKWDHTLVLFGPEGMGKSLWVDLVSRGYSASLGSVTSKDTLLAMQRSWIMLADEGYSLRKGDADQLKEFLTRRSDTFRIPFERDTLVHPRHSVIWSTTNDEIFLRKQEGNRRFLIVRCRQKVDFSRLTPEYVDQLWAEAVVMFRRGERLYLLDEESAESKEEREPFTEDDSTLGLIQEFLDTPVPEGYQDMSVSARVSWREESEEEWGTKGTERLDQVSSLQIWVEALGRRLGDHTRKDLLLISNLLLEIPGWSRRPGNQPVRLRGYGPQKVWERNEDVL